jgi:hypothetical protein
MTMKMRGPMMKIGLSSADEVEMTTMMAQHARDDTMTDHLLLIAIVDAMMTGVVAAALTPTGAGHLLVAAAAEVLDRDTIADPDPQEDQEEAEQEEHSLSGGNSDVAILIV